MGRKWIIAFALLAASCEPPPEVLANDAVDAIAATPVATEDSAISGLSGPQRNARREAESYLDMKGFSREGLIEQLNSDYGSGYAKADATAAVDSLTVDWNEQAKRAGESYLEMKVFSCNALK